MLLADATTPVGMDAVISALTSSSSGLTADTFFGVLADVMPLVVLLVPIALGVYFLRKLIKGAGKAKVKF